MAPFPVAMGGLDSIRLLTDALAVRAGRPAHDIAVRAVAGAILGALPSAGTDGLPWVEVIRTTSGRTGDSPVYCLGRTASPRYQHVLLGPRPPPTRDGAWPLRSPRRRQQRTDRIARRRRQSYHRRWSGEYRVGGGVRPPSAALPQRRRVPCHHRAVHPGRAGGGGTGRRGGSGTQLAVDPGRP